VAARVTSPVFVNARFRVQAVTGVQRFAGEIAAALPRVWPAGRAMPVLLAPAQGGIAGQVWEQAALPFAARSGVLVNLGNTGPVLGGRRLVVIHDAGVLATPAAYSWRFRAWYRTLHRLLFALGARIATVSRFSRDELVKWFGAAAAEIPVLGEGAEHILRRPADASVLEQYGLTRGRFVLVVGSLAAHKNLAALGPAAAMLAARGMELVVTGGLAQSVFAGGGALPQPARYIGRVDDAGLRALYEAAACFLFPSTYEGFGLPAVEAMACGCPVLAARAGALPETCGDAAAYCDPTSAGDIARQLAGLLDAPDRLAALRQAGPARAAEHSWPAAAARLRDVILEMDSGR
jgi:glycosyltransferase involved in cell wall biosynthesis